MSDIWPNFFIGGVAKGGTTSLYHYLKQHPQVFMPDVKEPRFFSRVNKIVSPRIEKQTDYLRLFAGAGDVPMIGEASPDYLWDELAPYRIQSKIPFPKFIFLLRDPLERAYSHYLSMLRCGMERQRSFFAALSGEFGHSYVSMGLYYEQIKRYCHVFNRERILILLFEDLKRDPQKLLLSIAEFLDIDSKLFDAETSRFVHNPYMVPRNAALQRLFAFRSFQRLVSALFRSQCLLRWYNTFWAPRVFKQVPKPPLEKDAAQLLQQVYGQNLEDLEMLLKRPLPELRRSWND